MFITIENDTFELLNIYAGFAGKTTEQLADLLLASALLTLIAMITEDKNHSEPQNSDSVLRCDCGKKGELQ